MRYDQVDQALQFLEKPGDRICLQVPWAVDVNLVRTYIIRNYAVEANGWNWLRLPGPYYVQFEVLSVVCASNGTGAGIGWARGTLFLIERLYDNYLPGVEACADA